MADSLNVQILKSLMDEIDSLTDKLKIKGDKLAEFLKLHAKASDFNELKNVTLARAIPRLSARDKQMMGEDFLKLLLKTNLTEND